MTTQIGTNSVLEALTDTLADFESTDLPGPRPPRPASQDPGDSRRYELGELLGIGGLGEVHEAFDLDLRRRVALKRPRADRSALASTLLIREAQITAQLEHPGVPSVHALGLHAGGAPFFTMTLVRGQTLSELIAAGISERRGLRIIVQLAYALAFAHERGVVHRDLKPDNIMVGAFGEVRLMDWGIAKVVGRDAPAPPPEPAVELSDQAQHQTQAGSFVGTPGYASPEQIAGSEDLDVRADIFALGVVLHQTLTGRPLFPGTAIERITKTLDVDRPRTPPGGGLSLIMAAVVDRATAHAAADRYASTLEMIRDLEAYLDGERVAAFKPSPWQLARSLYRLRAARARRFRAIDLDLIIAGHAAVGAGAAMLAALMITPPPWLGLLLLLIGALATAVPAYTLFRRERSADVARPSQGLSEGLRSRPMLAKTHSNADTKVAEPDTATRVRGSEETELATPGRDAPR